MLKSVLALASFAWQRCIYTAALKTAGQCKEFSSFPLAVISGFSTRGFLVLDRHGLLIAFLPVIPPRIVPYVQVPHPILFLGDID
jgi:hypothetical protein